MVTIGVLLSLIGFLTISYGYYRTLFRLLEGENKERILSFWCMIGWALYVVGDVLMHSAFVYVSTAFLAWFIYRWWNSGGGPGLKSKITKIVQKIIPTVVPAGSAA